MKLTLDQRLRRWLCKAAGCIPISVVKCRVYRQNSFAYNCARCDIITWGPWKERPRR